MVAKGFVQKEWLQNKSGFWAVLILLSIYTPASLFIKYLSKGDQPFVFYTDTFGIAPFLVFILAVSQMGMERGKGIVDFTLSLPYNRGAIFFIKWSMGVLAILLSISLNFMITLILLDTTHAEHGPLVGWYGLMLISLVMLYTLTFAAGALTGTALAQTVVAISAAILPLLVIGVTLANISIFFQSFYFDYVNLEWIFYITPVTYAGFFFDEPYGNIFYPLFMTVIFYFIGYFSYIKHPNERTGSFFLWKQLEIPIHILVILIGILSFSVFGYIISDETISGYVMGAVFGAVIAFFISYMLIFKSAKNRLK